MKKEKKKEKKEHAAKAKVDLSKFDAPPKNQSIANIINAHRAILVSASNLFSKILGVADKNIKKTDFISSQDINGGKIRGFKYIEFHENKVIITLSEEIPEKPFRKLLEFLYTGVCPLEKEETEMVSEVARIFECDELQTVCANIQSGDDFLNPSIGTWLNDNNGAKLARLFCNKKLWSDLQLQHTASKGKLFAHLAVIASRCPSLYNKVSSAAAHRYSHGRKVVNDDYDIPMLQLLLEYMYSDHCPIQENDQVKLIQNASKYGLTRLISLCELYLSKTIELETFKGIEKANIDIISILQVAAACKASQLENFCLHFISSNYGPMKKRPEWSTLSATHRRHIEENKWPPQSYLDAVDEYEKAMKAYNGGSSGDCSLM